MALQALPEKLNGEWRKAKCDETGETEYLIIPLSNTVATHVPGNYMSLVPLVDEVTGKQKVDKEGEPLFKSAANAGAVAVEFTQFALQGLKGVVDPDSDQPLDLKYDQVKIGNRNFKRLRSEYLDRLPKDLYSEILAAVNAAEETPDKEEADNVGFTPDSSTPDLTNVNDAPETKPDAHTESETDCSDSVGPE